MTHGTKKSAPDHWRMIGKSENRKPAHYSKADLKEKRREPACKPGSVQPAKAGLSSHSSGMPVTRHLKQPTRIQCGTHL